MAEVEVATCTCRHSVGAHKNGVGHCTFCSCEKFHDKSEAPKPKSEPLSDRAVKALSILSANPGFKHVPEEHLTEMARFGRRRLFLANAVLMEQGEPSDNL